ncbi:Transmembrane protease serine 11B-like protein [Bienertia sinuspersici]
MVEGDTGGEFRQACHKCGEPLARQDAEEHHLTKHAVTEILEGDSSRKVIEMIFKAGWTNSENRGRVERILKVHNPQTKLAKFEEYREMVKIRANKLQHSKKHPRLLADGNELLRFYGTTIACSLGKKGSSSLCTLQRCNCFGIFTTSTSEAAYRSIEMSVEASRKALIVCRVIAGRVHRPMVENVQEFVGGKRSGFDSLAGKLGSDNSHIEELYLLKSTALLPCFVIVCKQ